jgi:hypothetical protein
MPYFTLRGRVESIEDTSYTRKAKKGTQEVEEPVQRFQLTLTVPGMGEGVKCDLSPERVEGLPTQAKMDQWELDETWVVVTADAMRTAQGKTEEGRVWVLVTFAAVAVAEMDAQEKARMAEARKKVKTARKVKAAEARKAKQAAKKTANVAA